MSSGVYMIANKVNGKVYIGSSIDIERRKKEHFNRLNNGTHKNKYLLNSFNKHGRENFEHYVLKKCKEDDLIKWEQYFIDNHQSTCPACGYNLSLKAGRIVLNEETRKKISRAMKGRKVSEKVIEALRKRNIGNKYNLGRSFTKKHKEKISKSNKGKIFTKEHRKKLSEWQKGEKHPNYGKHHSEETKKKIGAGNKGKIVSIETRKKLSKSNIGKHHSLEARKKMSEARKGKKHPNYGRTPSVETRKKISEGNKGKTLSVETRKKMSEAKKLYYQKKKAEINP